MEEARLRSLWRELHLESIVKWIGDVTQRQLAAEYQRADVFCLPSIQEGFGIVFLEAMAAGKPIVAARSAAVPEVVQHGCLVEPDNAEALAAAIETLYFDAGLRMRLGAEGLQAVQHFEMKRVALSFLEYGIPSARVMSTKPIDEDTITGTPPRFAGGPYVLATAAVIGSALLRLAVDPFAHDEAPLLIFAFGVVIAALYGGFSAGIVATILSIPVADYLFIQPRYTFFVYDPPSQSVMLIAFALLGLAIERHHRTAESSERASAPDCYRFVRGERPVGRE